MFAPSQLRYAIGRRSIAPHLGAVAKFGVATLVAAWFSIASATSLGASLADPPAPPTADEILLISTRAIGIDCDGEKLNRELDCKRLMIDANGRPIWVAHDWHNLQRPDNIRETVIYVHGNRVSVGMDETEGMAVYQSIITARAHRGPLRYIIWSWPSSQIPGLIKDYQVKAVRTNPVAWQLAWFLDKLPTKTPLALMGYSYGARTVSGTMHLLAGGSLGNLKLEERQHPERPPIRVALMAAAFDADWILPGEMHQRAIQQVDRMVVVTNRHDPAMRFFKLSTRNSRADALGLAGVPHKEKLGTAAKRIQYIDVSAEVGHSHVIYDYLADVPKMNRMWQQVLDGSSEPTQDMPVPAYAHLRPQSVRR
jgi:hypothetical protein